MGKVLALALAVSCAVAMPAAAQTTWEMPTPYPDDNFHTKNIRQFAEDVDKATNGQLKLVVRSAGSAVKHADIKKSVQQGQMPLGEVLVSLHAKESPIYAVDSVPFLATSYAQARKLYAAQRPLLEQRLAEEGLVLIYSVPWPPQGVYAKKELRSLDDLKGLKIRTYNPATARIAELVSATGVQVEVPELKSAFADGRVEVNITSGATGVQARFWEFVSHFHDTQAWLPRNMVFASKAAHDALTPELRLALRDAAAKAETRGWAASEQEAADRIRALKENGMTIVEPAPALKEGLAGIGRQMAAEWEASAGSSGNALLASYRRSGP